MTGTVDPALARLAADAVAWLSEAGVPHVIIGGVAAGMLGRPRMTRDLDIMTYFDSDDIDGLLATAGAHSIAPRISGAVEFARRRRVLLLRHLPTGLALDVSLGVLLFEKESVGRSRMVECSGALLPFPSPEDLVIMKAVAHRTLDLGDIEGVLIANPATDLARVRGWVRQFAEVLEMPEIVTDLEAVIKRVRSMRRR